MRGAAIPEEMYKAASTAGDKLTVGFAASWWSNVEEECALSFRSR
jgi:hypothetical protein